MEGKPSIDEGSQREDVNKNRMKAVMDAAEIGCTTTSSKNAQQSTALDVLEERVDNEQVREMLPANSHLTIEIAPTFDDSSPAISFKDRMITSIIRFKRDTAQDTRNALLVIVALIVTITCQGSLTPPGGVWQDNNNSSTTQQTHRAGKVVMSDLSFLLFWFLNSVTLWTAELAFFFLVDGRYSILLFVLVYLFSQCNTLSLALVSPSHAISTVIITISAALPLLVFILGYCFFHRAAKRINTNKAYV